MLAFLIRRTFVAAIIIFCAITLLVIMINSVPGDPASILLGPRATPEMKEVLRREMGLDASIPQQVVIFIWNVFQGDLGTDVFSKRPVLDVVMDQLPYTLILISVSMAGAALIGIPLGCYSALHRGSWLDNIVGILSVSAITIPAFVIAIYSVLIFSISLKWLPAIGVGERGDFFDQATHLILPAVSIGLNWVGYLSRFVRSSMLEVLGEQHIRTARAHGLSETKVVFQYALPLAVLPTITIIGIGIGYLLSAAVLTEIVFARPGVGKLLYDSVTQRNFPVVMGTVLITTILFVVTMTLADLVNGIIDPRARDQA
ncbi:ABC transporter permease [Roseovarius indicus]|uniref:Glutathione transport system permease protein GsiC n=1 Tax=Roseovarius indicus TaxID=540747 RepID=A0A0T5P1N4_9RHOB|nr:ABC transporter permease [Roseovarius indicus]KRS15027.1 peptide ABC transporter permease [Roseovarius indicus]QEW25347.1 Glutathione transport system permease protein GsiC [Roseovarius indicus]SFE21186.1 peptide/nickel transport system permease protein [Roseovarius indicus]